jgi:hypothetical protein
MTNELVIARQILGMALWSPHAVLIAFAFENNTKSNLCGGGWSMNHTRVQDVSHESGCPACVRIDFLRPAFPSLSPPKKLADCTPIANGSGMMD